MKLTDYCNRDLILVNLSHNYLTCIILRQLNDQNFRYNNSTRLGEKNNSSVYYKYIAKEINQVVYIKKFYM